MRLIRALAPHFERFAEKLPDRVPPVPSSKTEVFDYRGQQPLSFKGPGRFREPSEIIAICAHQTGIEFAAKQRHIAEAIAETPENVERARMRAYHRRFIEGVPYHVLATRTCDVLFISDVLAYKYHGDRLSHDSVGWSVEGRFPAFARDRTSKHTQITDARVGAWRASLRHAISQALDAGCPLRFVWAHRQGDGGKPGDPGEELWKAVVMPIAIEFGLAAQPNMTRTQLKGPAGLALPSEWQKTETI